ncbi:DUF1566 domain-containing protein [Sulfuricurvum sp.]|uniref:Lcl C-terminal domain-containing protein n=1 Tax=Sulfuricurvum sp. TaxID=2025608 RepID=UPI003BB74EDA
MRRFSLFLLLGMALHADIKLSETEMYTQEEARLYCRDLGSGWRQMGIGELFVVSAQFHDNFSYWSSDQGPSDSTVIGTGSEGDGGIIAMVGYSFYPKEKNITLSPPSKKIAAACTDASIVKAAKNFHQFAIGVEDRDTGIVWHSLEATDKKAKFTFEKGKEHCDNLTLEGRAWRLPTLNELYGIVDYSRYRPTVNMQLFGAMMHRYYWSSDALNEAENFVVGFKLGSVATVSKKEEAYVRCVSELP